jgi:hypothetical protein
MNDDPRRDWWRYHEGTIAVIAFATMIILMVVLT